MYNFIYDLFIVFFNEFTMSEKKKENFQTCFFLRFLWLELWFLYDEFMISGPLGPGRVRVSESSWKKHVYNMSKKTKKCFLMKMLQYDFFYGFWKKK